MLHSDLTFANNDTDTDIKTNIKTNIEPNIVCPIKKFHQAPQKILPPFFKASLFPTWTVIQCKTGILAANGILQMQFWQKQEFVKNRIKKK